MLEQTLQLILQFIDQNALLSLFVSSLIGSSILPYSVEAVMLLGLLKFDILTATLVVTAGSTIGGSFFYLVGVLAAKGLIKLKGHGVKESKKWKMIEGWVKKYGAYFMFFAAFTPFPYDPVAIGAGMFRMPLPMFFLSSFMGRLARFFLLGLFGAGIMPYMSDPLLVLITAAMMITFILLSLKYSDRWVGAFAWAEKRYLKKKR